MQPAEHNTSTEYSKKLFQALCDRGIDAQMEYKDGHKTVDIAILKARIYIEVDGIQHFTVPKQIIADFSRQHYSDKDNFRTFYVTNQILERFTDEVADALAKIVKDENTKENISSIL